MLTYRQRDNIRSSIKRFTEAQTILETSLRTGASIPEALAKKLSRITFTSDPEAQLRAVTEVSQEMTTEYMSQLLTLAPNDMTAYAEYLNPEEYPAHWHQWLCERLMEMERGEDHALRMLISAPPGHAKSTYSSRIFPSWYMGRNPSHKYIQAGHTQNFCENEFGKKTKAIVDSDIYRNIFPKIALSKDSKAAGYWGIAEYGGSYLTRGVGQGIAGFRANCAGVDDPFATREDAESQTIRDKVWDWFSADFTTRLLPRSPMFVVATRWHSDDLCGRVEEMNREGKGIPWLVVNLPAIAVEDKDVLGRLEGDPLWGEFYTLEHLMNLKATLPARDWNSLYMGKPMDEDGGVIQGSWISRYDTLPAVDQIKRITVSADTAMKTGERNDYTAILVWIEGIHNDHYLAYVHRERMEFDDMVRRIENIATQWGATAIIVEDKGSGTQYVQTRAGKAPCSVIPISTSNNSKEFRLDGVSPMFESGQVLLPKTASWVADYESELLGFPTAKYDDQVDATSQYLNWARQRQGRGTVKLQGISISSSSNNNKVVAEIEDAIAERARAVLDPVSGNKIAIILSEMQKQLEA